MSAIKKEVKRVTTKSVIEMKAKGEKIAMLTAYDYTFAKLLDSAGIEILLVGDSASNVMAGHDTTLPITLDQMIYHAASVVRGAERALIVVDLPFGTYQSNPQEALRSAVRIMKETGAHAIKLEGGKEEAEAKKLKEDALLLEQLGCFGIVLEKIPAALAAEVAQSVRIPIIGIGAGNGVDGQVLVMQDVLGMSNEFHPKFLRKYANLHETITQAVANYIQDVKSLDFPNEKEQY